MADRCHECGAPTNRWTCEELVHEVLALDHQRLQPWGALHGIVVACYLLQHSSGDPHRDARLRLVVVFCEAGLDGLQRVTNAARERNSHRVKASKATPPPVPDDVRQRAFGVTIHDVAVDGTFPADGYAERVGGWANAVRAAWTT